MGDSYEAVRPGRRQDSTNRFTLARVRTGPERNATTGEGKLSDRASADARCRLTLSSSTTSATPTSSGRLGSAF